MSFNKRSMIGWAENPIKPGANVHKIGDGQQSQPKPQKDKNFLIEHVDH